MSHHLRSAILSALVLNLPSAAPARAEWPANGIPVSIAPGNQSQSRCHPDGAGGLYIAWIDDRADEGDIYLQHLSSDGSVYPGWPAGGLAICTAHERQSDPEITSDGQGGVIVAWNDERASYADQEDYDVYALRLTATGSPAAGWPENGVAVCACPGWQYDVEIAADGAGGAYIVWVDETTPGYRVQLQRIGPDGAPSPGWPAGGHLVGDSQSTQRFAVIANDGMGGALVVSQSGDRSYRAQRVTGAGSPAPGWSPDGVFVGATGRLGPAELVADGDGGGFVVWSHLAGDHEELFAQHLTGTGEIAAGWPLPGLSVAASSDRITVGQAVSDQSAGFVAVWSTDREIYAVRVLPSGATAALWPPGGRLLTRPNGNAFLDARVLAAGDAGFYFTWFEYSPPLSDRVMIQRLDSHGSIPAGWSVEAGSVTSTRQDFGPAIATDGSTGALIAWTSTRGGDADIYAQHVAAEGRPLDAGFVPEEVFLTLDGFFPNPTIGGETVVGFRLPRDGRTTLQIFDVAGRLVAERRWTSLGAGPHRVSLGRVPWAAGVYLIRLHYANELRFERGVVLR